MFWNSIQPFVRWLGATAFGEWLGQSTLRIAWLLTFHLFGLTVFLGTILILNLRLLGLMQRRKPVAQFARELAPGIAVGLPLMLVSGAVIFTGGAQGYYESEWFRTKMTILFVALLFHFTLYRSVTHANEGRFSPLLTKLTGAMALLLWFAVGFAGRAIGFF